MTNEINIRLPVVFCLLVDFPNNSIDCSPYESNPQVCYECPVPVIWFFILTIGIFGACSNCLIIAVLRKHHQPRAFDIMLLILANFDLTSSVMASISSTAMVMYYEGIDRGLVTLILYYVPFLICMIGRSGSVYMTILITIERFLVLAFPIQSSVWFTSLRTKLFSLIIVILATVVNVPRFTSIMIGHNDPIGQRVHSLRDLTYIIKGTELEVFWYDKLSSVHYAIDIWLPFPLLIMFNVLLYIEIRKFTNKRRELNKKLSRDIRAARMFVPIVLVLFICNLVPIIHYGVLMFKEVYYRELVLGMALSIVLNSAANLPIYYARGPSFRGEIRAAVAKFCRKGKGQDKHSVELSLTTVKIRNEATSS